MVIILSPTFWNAYVHIEEITCATKCLFVIEVLSVARREL